MRPPLVLSLLLFAFAASARAQPEHPETVGEFIDMQFSELESKNDIQHQIPTPPHAAPKSDAERRFLSWFDQTPDLVRLDGNWLLVNEAKDGETRYNASALKTDAGLERSMIVSVSGSGQTMTAMAIGTNIDGVNQNSAQQDHVTSPVEFSITGQFMRFQFEETYSELAANSPPYASCEFSYWCRNWDHATHLVCQVESACLRRDKTWAATEIYHQDFFRAKPSATAAASASESNMEVPAVPEIPDGALLPGMDLKAPPPP